jgi:hypothetical protein
MDESGKFKIIDKIIEFIKDSNGLKLILPDYNMIGYNDVVYPHDKNSIQKNLTIKGDLSIIYKKVDLVQLSLTLIQKYCNS